MWVRGCPCNSSRGGPEPPWRTRRRPGPTSIVFNSKPQNTFVCSPSLTMSAVTILVKVCCPLLLRTATDADLSSHVGGTNHRNQCCTLGARAGPTGRDSFSPWPTNWQASTQPVRQRACHRLIDDRFVSSAAEAARAGLARVSTLQLALNLLAHHVCWPFQGRRFWRAALRALQRA